jgi:hypothetical protein
MIELEKNELIQQSDYLFSLVTVIANHSHQNLARGNPDYLLFNEGHRTPSIYHFDYADKRLKNFILKAKPSPAVVTLSMIYLDRVL